MRALTFATAVLTCSLVVTGHAGERIITLTPHATELVFAAGAGDQIVGTVQSSDFPAAAKQISRVGDGLNTGAEQVIALNPGVVIGWPSPLISQLQSLGIQTYVSDPDSIEAIGQEVLQLGQSLGTLPQAQAWHDQFTQKIDQLTEFGTDQTDDPIRVVILASSDAQFVIGRHELINSTLTRCGAINPFAAAHAPAPQISPESLIAAKPDVIISGSPSEDPQFITLQAPLHVVSADSLYRPGPRFIEAALEICALASQARLKRSKQ